LKYTINELANSKGVSPLVREALLQMEAELDATNRQVEILSNALAESRREVAAPVQPVFELQESGWEIICDLDWIQTLPFGTKLYTAPPAAQPAPVQATMKLESSGPGHGPAPNQKLSVRHVSLIDAGKTAARLAVPDAIHHTDLSETLEYIQGWNDCRAEMLKEMK
jgi:hypothetical protein